MMMTLGWNVDMEILMEIYISSLHKEGVVERFHGKYRLKKKSHMLYKDEKGIEYFPRFNK